MTDDGQQFDPQAVWAKIEAERAAREALTTEALPVNKAALFDALAAVDITSVTVTFDGYGDEGQIEAIHARNGDDAMELPAADVELRTATWDGESVETRHLHLPEAIEQLCYDLLRQEHPGWENNDGAFGEFRFDVAERLINLDHNDRYTEISSYEHEW